MNTRDRSCFLAVALIASALSSRPAEATDAWGKFVAHVVQIWDTSGNLETHVLRTPSATVEWDAPMSPYTYGPSTYQLTIDVPEFTARGHMPGATDPLTENSFVDFATYSNTIPMSATMTASVAMSPLTEDDTIHWEDPGVEKAFQTVIGVNGPAQLAQNLSFPAAGGSGTVGGTATSNESFIGERGVPFITDLATHLPEWSTNPALREANRFDLSIDGRVLRQTGGDPEILRSLADFGLSVTTIYELVLEDPDRFPEPDPGVPYLEVISWEGDAEAKRGAKYYQAFNGMKLTTRDSLITGPESKVKVRFPDGSILELEEMSNFALGALIRQGNAWKAQILLRIGKVSAEVNPAKVANSDFDVKMPVATASIRGTVLTASYRESPQATATVSVSEGLVEVLPGFNDLEDPDAELVPHPTLQPFFLGGFETAEVTDEAITDIDLPRPRILVSSPRRFPATNIRKSSRPQVVTISNGAGESYSLVDIAVGIGGPAAKDFRIGPPATSVLAPGESTTTGPLTFRPLRKGVRRATMSVRGNAALVGVPLSGTGKPISKPKK